MEIRRMIRKPEGAAVISAFIASIITHCFCLINVMHNYDNIVYQPTGYGFGVTSGRWTLSLMGDLISFLGGNYNLPVVNGLLFLVILSICSGFLVSIFKIQNRLVASLMGILFVTFPSATSTMIFRYTAVYYGWGILFAILAVWVLNRYKFGLLLSALFTSMALGIYQAYTPITISVMVLLLIQQTLNGNSKFWDIFKRGVYSCAALVLGLVFYFLFLKITLFLYGAELTDYRGIDSMGQMSIPELFERIHKAVYTFCMMPLKDYYGLASTRLIKIAYLLLGGITAVEIAVMLLYIRKFDITVMTGLLCAVFPVAINFVVIMVPDGWIYTLMLYAFVVVAFVPLVLLDSLLSTACVKEPLKKVLYRAVVTVSIVLALSNAYQANINYTALYYANCQVENYLNSLVTQVRMTDGFDTEKKWAFIGDINDPLLHCYWQYEITYGGFDFTRELLRYWSMPDWIRDYCGYVVPLISDEEMESLSQTEAVKNMPCWPNDDSIQIVNDIVVIKFEEVALAE